MNRHVQPSANSPRSGSALLVVLGLMCVLIGLILAVSYRVRNTIINNGNFQRSVESYIQLQSSKLLIQGRHDDGSLPGAPVTAGDQLDLAVNGRPFANAIGWFHLKPASANIFDVVSTGGSGGDGGMKSGLGTITSAIDPARNSFDIRYHYVISYDPTAVAPASKFSIVQQAVQDNTLYPW